MQIQAAVAFCNRCFGQGDVACLVQVTEVYQERRLDAVFGMWDQNSDLRISFKELCEGLFRSAYCQTHAVLSITVFCHLLQQEPSVHSDSLLLYIRISVCTHLTCTIVCN